MDRNRKKELIEQYNQIKKYMGVYKITNNLTGRFYIGSNVNLKNKWGIIQAGLNDNMHVNAELQKDWKELGGANFSYEVLEEKEVKEDMLDKKRILAKMEENWIEKLQPFDSVGYNKRLV